MQITSHPGPAAPHGKDYLRTVSAALGVCLVLAGLAVLLGANSLPNWWAMFILFPALIQIGFCLLWVRHSAPWTGWAALGTIWPGLLLFLVAILFLFQLSWVVWWPLFLLIPGLAMAAFAWKLSTLPYTPARILFAWLASLGTGLILLAVGFLLQTLGWLALTEMFPAWWSVPLLIGSLGGWWLVATYSRRSFPIWFGSLTGAMNLTLIALIPLLGLDWDLLLAVLLIANGILYLASLSWTRK